jgi:prepilin-type N-terminal cleavage/methylation domain-containing protein
MRGESMAAAKPWHTRTRHAFTLVEMLVTVTILGILVSFVYGAMSAAETTAKIAKTRATIAKLHRLIMARYESFKTRRIPIDMSFNADTGAALSLTPAQMADIRLDAIREIMRQELPDCVADILQRPETLPMNSFQPISSDPRKQIVPPTSICQAYYDYMLDMQRNLHPWPDRATNLNTSAECLYLIITMSCPGGREQFSENEIGDTDNDGWPEFIDGWGRPIYFLRWAPRFIPQYGADSLLQTGNPTLQHDPFDTQGRQPYAYQLIPLIYSAGPDGESHILQDNITRVLNARRRDPFQQQLQSGWPRDANNPNNRALKHFDNIHNHRLEIR